MIHLNKMRFLALIGLTFISSIGLAQTDTTNEKKNTKSKSLEISNHGIKIYDAEKIKIKGHTRLHFKMHVDFGFNNVVDKTDYNTLPTNYFFSPNSNRQLSKNDLSLITGKSINVNFWPLWFSQDVVKHNLQIESGLGFQFFNYRYDTKVKHSDMFLYNDPLGFPIHMARFEEIANPSQLQGKANNKLGVSYISVPLMIRFNTTEKKGSADFTFAVGVIGSYKLKSWTKFYGEKDGGNYDVRDWMTQLTAEIGIPGVIKFYGTYALQPMYNNEFILRTPFAIGIRL